MYFSKKQLYEKETGNKYDEEKRIYEDLKKTNKKIQLSIYVSFINEQHKLYPFSGISNSKTITAMKVAL